MELLIPEAVPGKSVVKVAGDSHTCALLDTGAVRCWGRGSNGRLGYDNPNDVGSGVTSIIVAGDVNVGGTVTQISAGLSHTCALLDTGAVRCWGQGNDGRLGYGNTNDVGGGGTSIVFAGDVDVGGTVTQISAGNQHTCALLDTGAVRCWGAAGSGRLGYDGVTNVGGGGTSITAAGDVPVGDTVTQITAGSEITCALLSGDRVRCWGRGAFLGRESMINVGDGAGITIIAAGDVPVQ